MTNHLQVSEVKQI